MVIYRARWVLPVVSPPIENGAIAVEKGRIAGVGRAAEVIDRAASSGSVPSDDQDLGDVILLPGMVNAHTHLELGGFAGRCSARNLWDWLDELVALNRGADADARRRWAVMDGARASLAAGVTCVGDISRTGMNVELLRDAPIRKVCFVELISGALQRPNDAVSLRKMIEESLPVADGDKLWLGVSPHSLYNVTPDDFAAAAVLAAENGLPLTTHVLETTDEADWLSHGGGRIADFLSRFGPDRLAPTFSSEPVDLLARIGALNRSTLLAHVNYVTDEQIARIVAAGANVVWCPRTHGFFGHRPHRWRDMVAAGANVCLGTDSLASAASLSVLDEARFLAAAESDAPAQTLLEMVTSRAAAALGLGDCIGSLRPGHRADFITIPWDAGGPDDPTNNVIRGHRRVESTWIGGRRRHPRFDHGIRGT